ncbi:MAG: nicotinate (nicotinamide) nucleotide adenylyltransferase [Thermodesulfobacteriota bacterium]|nr:nicotinate (nicotinamide) nucleotide adenylyltransferase [Thermodesulfobacteriota bacterium]
MNTGLFGGTFNPVHRGHVEMAKITRQAFALDEIVVIPAANPPHKDIHEMADAGDRLHMARLAFDRFEGFRVSDMELRREGRSFTIDTVTRFLENRGANDRLYLILGLDAFLELHTWKAYMKLMSRIPLIVIRRSIGDNESEMFESYLKSTISEKYRFSREQGGYVHDALQTVFFHEIPPIEISATQARERVKAGHPADDLVPPEVATFIAKKGLYR